MKRALLTAVMGFVVLIPGRPAAASDPATSLQHLFKGEDCEAVSGLAGDWTAHGDLDGAWTVEEMGGRTYRLAPKANGSDPSDQLIFDICLGHLGDYLFFDATTEVLAPDGTRVNPDDKGWVPVHFIGRVDIEANALHFKLLNDDWFQDSLRSGRIGVTVAPDDEGQFLLTAPSDELKLFVTEIASDPDALTVVESFERAPHNESAQFSPPRAPSYSIRYFTVLLRNLPQTERKRPLNPAKEARSRPLAAQELTQAGSRSERRRRERCMPI
jgi:hypothetical protein